MNKYVNTIAESGVEYNIQDARIPQVSASDEGKVVGVDEKGDLKLVNISSELPTVVNDRYLHTNASTGELEWSEVSNESEQIVIDLYDSEITETSVKALFDYLQANNFETNKWYYVNIWYSHEPYGRYSPGEGYLKFSSIGTSYLFRFAKVYSDDITGTVTREERKDTAVNPSDFESTNLDTLFLNMQPSFDVVNFMPEAGTFDNSKTYIVKVINGHVRLVEEIA